jgi:hypothetical protein
MTLTAFLIILGLLVLAGRAYWISNTLEEEYEYFCIAVDNYHARHNAVARMAIMRGKEFKEWPLMPHFESYSKSVMRAFFDPRIWSRRQLVNRKYLNEFEQDLDQVKKTYYE